MQLPWFPVVFCVLQLFEDRVKLVLRWFDLWTDRQRKHLMSALLGRCTSSQLRWVPRQAPPPAEPPPLLLLRNLQVLQGSADGDASRQPAGLHRGAASCPVPVRDVLPEPAGPLRSRSGQLALEVPG